MALYKNSTYVRRSTDDMFDTVYSPGKETPHSGIYRCENCGREIASNKGNPLPSQNHHQHLTKQGDIKWQLLVSTDGNA